RVACVDVVEARLALDGLAQLVVLGSLEPEREHLSAREADIDLCALVVGHQCLGSTSSVNTPPVAFGCRNATRLPRMPMRGSSSIRRSPALRTFSSAESMSSVW